MHSLSDEEKETFLILAGWSVLLPLAGARLYLPSEETIVILSKLKETSALGFNLMGANGFMPSCGYPLRIAYFLQMLPNFNEKKSKKEATKHLARINKIYHESLDSVIREINEILNAVGFMAELWPNNEKSWRDVVKIGIKSHLILEWYEMPSGHYEINAYIS